MFSRFFRENFKVSTRDRVGKCLYSTYVFKDVKLMNRCLKRIDVLKEASHRTDDEEIELSELDSAMQALLCRSSVKQIYEMVFMGSTYLLFPLFVMSVIVTGAVLMCNPDVSVRKTGIGLFSAGAALSLFALGCLAPGIRYASSKLPGAKAFSGFFHGSWISKKERKAIYKLCEKYNITNDSEPENIDVNQPLISGLRENKV